MKKKNGFTLIELLVVIALTISILGIAIVSFINISERKKKEAWDQVQGQIETAATEYFTANEYLFEGLSDKVFGQISVGKLVLEDYINKVTDPRNGKSVDTCSLIKVEKSGGKLTAKYIGTNSDKCDSDNSVVVSEPGAPTFELTSVCKNKGGTDIKSEANGWCYSKEFSLTNVTANGAITSIKHCNASGINCIPDIEDGLDKNVSISGLGSTSSDAIIAVSVSNQKATTTKYEGYKIDRNVPYGSVALGRNTGESYNSNRPKISINAKDDHSGIYSAGFGFAQNSNKVSYWDNINSNTWTPVISYSYIYKGQYATNPYSNGSGETVPAGAIALTVTDKVGNVGILNNNQYALYTKCSETNTSVSNGSWSSCSKACDTGTRTRTNTTNVTDKYTGVACPGNGATASETGYCNEQGCCSSTEEYGSVNWGSWSDKCDSSDKRTANGTQNIRSAYDHATYCGTVPKTKTKACDLTPSITKVQFRYNKSKCPNGWVEIRYRDINMAKYSATMTYSHSVQGTTTTATTDNSSYLDETFCRGYGSSKNNVMTFSVKFKNNTSSKERTYSGSCKWSKMFNSDGSHNSSWHDCTMN